MDYCMFVLTSFIVLLSQWCWNKTTELGIPQRWILLFLSFIFYLFLIDAAAIWCGLRYSYHFAR